MGKFLMGKTLWGFIVDHYTKKSLRIYLVERWESRKIENGRRMGKWENRKDFNFSHFYLIKSKKVEG